MRRSLFTTEVERSKFLSQLVAGTRDILKQQQGLSEHSNYHEFCRMLGRLKTNYQLCELVGTSCESSWLPDISKYSTVQATMIRLQQSCHSIACNEIHFVCPQSSSANNRSPHMILLCFQVSVESYPEWIQLVADFTIKSLNSWQWASASIFYLLGLWSRLVSSMPYLKGDAPSYMETCVPKIARAYITSR